VPTALNTKNIKCLSSTTGRTAQKVPIVLYFPYSPSGDGVQKKGRHHCPPFFPFSFLLFTLAKP